MATYVPQEGDFVTLSFDPQTTSENTSLAGNAEKENLKGFCSALRSLRTLARTRKQTSGREIRKSHRSESNCSTESGDQQSAVSYQQNNEGARH
jgi:hypothetical protein